MTLKESVKLFVSLIEADIQHGYYEKTEKVASFAHQVVTGEDMGSLITSVRRREDEVLKEQRINLTKPLTPAACNLVMKYYRKLRRTQGLKVENKWEKEGSDGNKQIIESSEKRFFANQPLSEYIFDTLEHYTFLDPNAFLVFERENILDEEGRISEVKTYPIVVPYDQVRWCNWKFGNLEVLVVEKRFKEDDIELSEFYIYTSGHVTHIREYKGDPNELTANISGEKTEYVNLEIEITEKKEVRTFEYFHYPNGTKEVPAIRLSAYLDPSTNAQTGATPLRPVKELLEQLINIGSLHDLTTFLHSIPRRREVVQACDFQDSEGNRCQKGYMSGPGYVNERPHKCPQCQGSGEKSITSEQDSIRITVPPGTPPDEIPDLSKFAHVEEPNVELLRVQQEKLDWLLQFIVYAVFTREQVSMSDIVSLSKTATERQLDEQDVYDQMLPYAQLFSQIYMLAMRCITYYNDISEGFSSSHQFPDDYQFETEANLIDKLQKARDAKAPYYVIERINMQLVRRQTNSMEEADRVKAWEKWRPFRGLSEEAIVLILADRSESDFDRVLYENFGTVQREVEQEKEGMFYAMNYQGQQKAIEEKIEELRGRISYKEVEAPELTF